MIGRLHVITDFFFQQRWSHAELAEFAIRGGADTIQFRQKHGSERDWLSQANELAAVTRQSGTAFIINDRIAIALAVGASGVHLGQGDLPVRIARQLLGSRATIGATATTLSQAQRAERDGANYIGFGPVYPTRSKGNPASVKGLSGLKEVSAGVSIPVIAVGGIKPENVRSALQAGAHGVAIMTALSLSSDPMEKARHFVSLINSFFD